MQETAERNGGQQTLVSGFYRSDSSDDGLQMLISGALIVLLVLIAIAFIVYVLYFLNKCLKAQKRKRNLHVEL